MTKIWKAVEWVMFCWWVTDGQQLLYGPMDMHRAKDLAKAINKKQENDELLERRQR